MLLHYFSGRLYQLRFSPVVYYYFTSTVWEFYCQMMKSYVICMFLIPDEINMFKKYLLVIIHFS